MMKNTKATINEKKEVWKAYRRLADGTPYDVSEHDSREKAVEAAIERQRWWNRGYLNAPYTYYVVGTGYWGTTEPVPCLEFSERSLR